MLSPRPCPFRLSHLFQGGLVLGLTLLGLSLSADPFPDPAPPTVSAAPAPATEATSAPVAIPGLTYHGPPKPLSPEAVTAAWPRFLGPTDNAKSPETHLLDDFPEEGLKKVWELEKGISYTSPVIAGGKLVIFNRFENDEVVQCLDPETGKQFWSYRYPVAYTDRYGFNGGPRASAVLDSGKVYTLGVTSVLTCLDLASGTKLWQRHLATEFPLATYFFGHGSCPLVHDGKVIVPMGTTDNLSVAAFDQHSGRLLWGTRHPWNASYASPVIATLQGEERLLVFGGGESDPPSGGLLCIDPATGALHDAFPWRPDKFESVNGATPVAVGNDSVFISASYGKGGVLLHLNADLKWEERWQSSDFGMHWTTPLLLDGVLYGFPGRNEPDAWFAAYSVETGEEAWRIDPDWTVSLPSGRDYRMKYLRGCLLHADGRTYALGELGSLGIMHLSSAGVEEVDRTQLFLARSTWSLPVLHRGLLYIVQHEPDMDGHAPRLICYDFRK
ncbi:MAG: PQQ-binding-like beta-propeller repeat protein [Verrucomicrobiaceae bacterium]|nr:PQQ-binding-like beta-propeller repeat protein [Verrucomicrobiaceae bacterium]